LYLATTSRKAAEGNDEKKRGIRRIKRIRRWFG